jgi:O-acetyl-ADP-ribose deacetylase (regulator of RNase III)
MLSSGQPGTTKMIEYRSGNLLEADAEALVNTVNTVGVMGKGIALQFKQAFPANFAAYEAACRRGEVQPGHMLVVPSGQLDTPRWIINFPTKRHWKGKSRLDDIEAGLADLIAVVRERAIQSIAVPPLGCGNGGLRWEDVRPRIEAAFAALPDVRVLLYAPEGAPEAAVMPVSTREPRMTPGRAAMVGLMARYATPGYRLTMLEIQKLAYLLQVAGEPLKLTFTQGRYGPYAETIHHVLQRIEGHFIRGYGDRSRDPNIQLLPGADQLAEDALQEHPQTLERFDRVAQLIEGFETPRGLELLATVHWVVAHNGDLAARAEQVVEHVHGWNEHKKSFPPNQIVSAWSQLRSADWV